MPGEGEQASLNYEESHVSGLFDKMGASYDVVNLVSSFWLSQTWRRRCVSKLRIRPGDLVADLMSGSGECLPSIHRRNGGAAVLSLDFSPGMCSRQAKRKGAVDVRCVNVLRSGLGDESIDKVVCAFGLKTFNDEQLAEFSHELHRILRLGGVASMVEISVPERFVFRGAYLFYIDVVIPLIGRLCLGDIDCYRMLGVYTRAFQSCRRAVPVFEDAGFRVELEELFFGCATLLVVTKVRRPSFDSGST